MLLLFTFQLAVLDKLDLSIDELTISLVLFQHMAFFAYGGSNAISSVDLSNAYNGVGGYNVAAVGGLTFVSNWAGPIWWSSGLLVLLARRAGDTWLAFQKQVHKLTLFVCISILSVMMACTILRAHLFIWTVFSPKFLFSMAWIFGHHIGVNILLSALMLLLVPQT